VHSIAQAANFTARDMAAVLRYVVREGAATSESVSAIAALCGTDDRQRALDLALLAVPFESVIASQVVCCAGVFVFVTDLNADH
jgi:hypothetical protein